jgi:hypothetical protein
MQVNFNILTESNRGSTNESCCNFYNKKIIFKIKTILVNTNKVNYKIVIIKIEIGSLVILSRLKIDLYIVLYN